MPGDDATIAAMAASGLSVVEELSAQPNQREHENELEAH
jgi:hypothetical protein